MLRLVQKALPLLLVHVLLVARPTSPVVMRLLLLDPHRRLRHHIVVVRRVSAFDGLASNVALASAASRVLAVALVTFDTFANNATIDIRRVIGADVGGACDGLASTQEDLACRLHTATAVGDWWARH